MQNSENITIINSIGQEYLRGLSFIKYYVYDYSLNYASATLKVILKDTTSPIIKVNIENDKVYKSLEKIEYEVVDNLSSNVIVNVYLDGEL